MGRYVEWETFVGRYPDAARISGAESTASYWLSYAEFEVDARLAQRYTVPFTPAPPLVQDLVMDLTYYRMNLKQKWASAVWSSIEERLTAIINGTLALVDPNGVALEVTNPSGMAFNSTSGWGTSFGMDDPVEWNVDSQWMETMEGVR